MAKRYLNWKLAVVVVIGLTVLGITGYGLRQWQTDRRAEQGLVLGNKAYNEHRWKDAARNLGRYLAVVKDDVPVMFKYAEAQLNIRPVKRNNVHHAIATYRTILRMPQGDSQAATRLTEIYLAMGMPGEAELIATRALKTNQSPELRSVLAIALADQRKVKEAVKELKRIIEEYPGQILAYRVLGRLVEQHPEDFSQEPEFWFDEAVRNNPSSAHAYIIRGAFHLRHDRRPQAIADLVQAEQKDLSDPNTRLELAGQFLNVDDLDRAQEHLEIVQRSHPANQLLWRTWARLALKSDSKAIMLQVAETGLKELSSQPWDFMLPATELFIRCGKLDLAADCINKLRQNDIQPAATAFLEGLLADKKGYGYEAVKCWYKAMQLGAKPARIRIAVAAALSRLGDKHSAIRQLRTLVSEQPNLLSGRLNLARLLTEIGNWDEAAEQARIAMQISSDDLDAALLYTQAQIQLLPESQKAQGPLICQNIEEHLANLEQATDGAPEVTLLRSQIAMRKGDFEAAQTLVMELRKAFPSQLRVAMAEIELLTAWGKTDQAILKSYDAVSAFPNSFRPVRRLAALLAAKGERQKCETVVKAALSRIKQHAAERELGLLLASLYNRWNEQAKRYQLLDTLVQKYPDDIPLRRDFLKCEYVLSKPRLAQELVDQIKTIEGENGWQWRYEQAEILATQDNFSDHYPRITMLLKEALLTTPDNQASRMLLARTYERAGELRLAVSTYSEALSRSPRDIRIIVPTVTALYKANEYDRAEDILRQAASQNLFHPGLNKLQLQSYLRRGELGSACNVLEDWRANEPNNSSVCLSLALLKMRQNSFTEAAQLLDEVKIQEPDALLMAIARIELNARQGRSVEAIRLCDQIINKLNSASAYVLRGRTYAMLGQADTAKKDFEHATIIEPNNARAWVAKSDFCRSTEWFDEAVACIRKAMSLEPDDLGIHKRAVSLLLASGDRNAIREATSILDYALTSYPGDAELRIYKVRLLLAKGTAPATKQAAAILQEITEDQPNLSDAWALWAEIALRQEQSAKAMNIVLRGLFHQPYDKSLLLLKARLETASSPALAVPTLKALLDIYPNDTDIVLQLAKTYSTMGQSQKALNLLRDQLDSCSNTSEERKIRIAFATALHENGNSADAQKEFDSLLRSDPDDPKPLLAQARLLKEQGLWEQLNHKVIDWYRNHPNDTHTPVAVAGYLVETKNMQAGKTAEGILRMILERDSYCTEAMSVLAMLLQTTGRPQEAAGLYQRILMLQPDNVITINNLAWILCEEQGKYQKALEFAQRGLEKAPDYIDLIDTRGVAYYRLGEFNKSVQDLNQCVNLYPPRTPSLVASHFHLARALAGLGQKDEAIENLNKTLELNNKIGGLSAADFAETHRLLKELSPGS